MMYISTAPLQERLDLLNSGCCAHTEYIVSLIYRFADLPVAACFRGIERDRLRLARKLDIPETTLQAMTYRQLARTIDSKLCEVDTYDAEMLHDAIEILAYALTTEPMESDGEQTPILITGQRISLDERLKGDLDAKSCLMLVLQVESLFPFFDDIISPGKHHFARIYEEKLARYGDVPFEVLVGEGTQLPEAERKEVLYHLLIHPFAQLPENPLHKKVSAL